MKKVLKKALKEELKKAFEAPAPLHKTEFLQKLHSPGLNLFDFLLIQIRYIRKRIWGVSILAFMISLFGSLLLSVDMLWAISAFMPLLALMTVTETSRSEHYKMAELEMATRFSLKSVLLARLGILGIGNLLILCLFFPVSLCNSRIPPTQIGFYIITPFLLTTFICLYIVLRHREKETIYFCTGISICISFLVFVLHSALPRLYEESAFTIWIFTAVLLCIAITKQYHQLIKQEELTWNLS